MDFRDYTYVKAIAEYGTISKAADALYISQPSLSKFLTTLEQKIGTPLFLRINRQLLPTCAGKAFLDTGEQIFVLQKQLNDTLAQISHHEAGLLSVATTSARGSWVLPAVLPEFKRRYPKYHIEIYEHDVDHVERALSDGSSNLAIYAISRRNPNFFYYHIASEEVVLLLPSDSPYAQSAIPKSGFRYPWLDLTLLEKETFFLNDDKQWQIGRTGHELLREAHIFPQIIYLRNHDTCLALASRGIGYAFTFEISVRHFSNYITPPVYCSVGACQRTTEFAIAVRKDYQLSPVESAFIGLISACFGELTDETPSRAHETGQGSFSPV